jgi:ABC-type branched-subunit amino acid transport system ATPase component
MEYLSMFGVDQFADQLVVNLPYGAQRRVEMARAMVIEPKVLLLDEPTVGMTPDEMMSMIEVVRKAHERFNLAIFLIEHRLRVVMNSASMSRPWFSEKSSWREHRMRSKTIPRSSRPTSANRRWSSDAAKVENLRVSYGNIKALHGIDFTIDDGEIVTIIGANGAGKKHDPAGHFPNGAGGSRNHG